jgi:hypothetical protein
MHTYICCRCKNCTAQIVLEDLGESDIYPLNRPSRPRAGREACPYCRAVFKPVNYYMTESGTPLVLRAEA